MKWKWFSSICKLILLHRNQADVFRTPGVFSRPTAEQQTLVSPHVCNNLLMCFDIRPWGMCVFLCMWAVWVWERQREREDRMTADSPAGSQTADSPQPWHPPVSRLRHTLNQWLSLCSFSCVIVDLISLFICRPLSTYDALQTDLHVCCSAALLQFHSMDELLDSQHCSTIDAGRLFDYLSLSLFCHFVFVSLIVLLTIQQEKCSIRCVS